VHAGSEVENVGWVIPTSVVAHFLDDFQKNGRYTGFPMLGVQWQSMESDALKRHMKMNVRSSPLSDSHQLIFAYSRYHSFLV
jgi:S1-C subfamily serine protease